METEPPALRSLYAHTESLRSYLERILDIARPNSLLFDHDDESYRRLLEGAWIGLADIPDASRVYRVQPSSLSQSDVIDRALQTVYRGGVPNVLTKGYTQRAVNEYESNGTRQGLTNVHTNTIITTLSQREFRRLLQRIGYDAMLHILVDTSLFLPTSNGCFAQATGVPVDELVASHQGKKRKRSPHLPEYPSVKRARLHGSTHKLSANEVTLNRGNAFYGRPVRVHGKIVPGLSLRHVLNSKKLPRGSPSDGECMARHILKYIFPLEYGLPSRLFPGKAQDPAQNLDEKVKALGSVKTPKRLKNVIPIVMSLRTRHIACRYRSILSFMCGKKRSKLNSVDIAELIHEDTVTSQMMPRMSSLSTPPSVSHVACLPIPQQRPRFAEFACSPQEVYKFVSTISRNVIPNAFWGSSYNRRVVFKNLRQLIYDRRFEKMTLHTAMQGFRICDCDWLLPSQDAARKQRATATDMQKRRSLAEQFLLWYFDGFVLPLLQTNFYITESSIFRNRVLYFRHDDWIRLCRPLVKKLCEQTFKLIPTRRAMARLRDSSLGSSNVRFVPKETGIRPVVNLSKRYQKEFGFKKSVNKILNGAFHILGCEQKRATELMRSNVHGLKEIYARLHDFKTRMMDASGNLPPLYFVKMDVRACFDTIEQSRLVEILKEVLREDNYVMSKYVQVNRMPDGWRRQFKQIAMPDYERASFLELAGHLARTIRQAILVDQVSSDRASRATVLDLLEQHITKNIVKIGHKYYQQVIGIPQGSVLSNLLCSFFYGDLERKKIAYSQDPRCLLMRLVDDYLFVSPERAKAENFARMMAQGHPEYGCFISPEKTLTNFAIPNLQLGNILAPGITKFPWCGIYIDTLDLSVSSDYGRYRDCHIADIQTVERGRRPGRTFLMRMKANVALRMQDIFIDASLNAPEMLWMNVYQTMLVTAMKMITYLKTWRGMRRNPDYITRCIDAVVEYAWRLLTKKRKREQTSPTTDCKQSKKLTRAEVQWLGYHAFARTFSGNKVWFIHVKQMLANGLRSLEGRVSRRKFQEIITRAIEGVGGLSF